MFQSPEDAAVAACLALLLEVSGNPKAGNVDRQHDFEDLKFEHFLASAAGAFPAFLNAASGGGIGRSILMAVKSSMRWHKAQNVHFGAFLLLIPLLSAYNEKSLEKICRKAVDNLKMTTFEDSLDLLMAFKISKARVLSAGNLDLQNCKTEKLIKERKINLYEWMKMAPNENLIARELVNGYKISLSGAEFILSNHSVVDLYYKLLSSYPDPLVIAKKGREYAERVMQLAREARTLEERIRLDEKLIDEGANPGTIADLTASSIFLALAAGWRV